MMIIIISVSFLKKKMCACLDLMKLRRLQNFEEAGAIKKKKTKNFLSQLTPGLCIDFHPIVSQPNRLNTFDGFNGAQSTGQEFNSSGKN